MPFGDALANGRHDVVIERARVGLLVLNAQLGQQVEDYGRLNLELPR
jgi:hypothetical protein